MVGPLLTLVFAVVGAWAVIIVVTTEEGEPGCAFGVFGFWSVCFIGFLADDPLVGIMAFAGTGIGIWLGVATVDRSAEPEWIQPPLFEEFRAPDPGTGGASVPALDRPPASGVARPDVEQEAAPRPQDGPRGSVIRGTHGSETPLSEQLRALAEEWADHGSRVATGHVSGRPVADYRRLVELLEAAATRVAAIEERGGPDDQASVPSFGQRVAELQGDLDRCKDIAHRHRLRADALERQTAASRQSLNACRNQVNALSAELASMRSGLSGKQGQG